MKKAPYKILVIIAIITMLIASLFYLSDIHFQLQYFKWKNFLSEVIMISLPIILSTAITIYMSYKAQKNRETNDTLV
ncbi:hypothetical protein A9Q93_09940 [Nonlabens dokdonensis]|uniref:Uncharacterized protein n=1 Tax=Nonlabens dokdonensis TaxID=328515 RepID=A0A1Z8ARF4_9FLAO|nr:hypothetical protein [Nonlabens dokdonensis]OUS12914.1 hypothetical protein A9Q93_09940 [Nonlabens dokdonensis]